MLVYFEFEDGSNPYVSKTIEETWHILCKYEHERTGAMSFRLYDEVKHNFPIRREDKKAILQQIAQEWQNKWPEYRTDFEYDNYWAAFFGKYGKRYGLLREFRENAIPYFMD